MFQSLLRPSSGQHLTVKGTISAHYTLWDPICLQAVRMDGIQYCVLRTDSTFTDKCWSEDGL